ncbi:LPS export ABC transporter periplasmic protein LptC [Pleomorphochaeta sp. DL1XJH-081]|uniref:LPS export ABC transporter periplasmic protein LptC n=1 Tax=Pleomorphochaeta sp. DL1XJH-081 TaxID=3409690 RepID=UPI003BB7F2F5
MAKLAQRTRSTLLVGAILILLLSCSFAPEEELGSGRPAEFPDMRLEETRYLLGVDGMEPIRIDAELIEVYQDAEKAYITEAVFNQFDNSDMLVFSGSFGAAEVDTSNNNISMEKGVLLRNHTDDFTIEAEALQWDNQNKKAYGTSDAMVTITMKEHDILRGTGFSGDFASAIFEFDHVEEGSISYE